MKYYIDKGDSYQKEDGSLCELIECVAYIPAKSMTYEDCDADSIEEACEKLKLTPVKKEEVTE